MARKNVNRNLLKFLMPAPKSDLQQELLLSLEKNTVTFVYGPPGAGKTLLATAYGLQMFSKNKISKMIFTRPVVLAFGEKMGYLPGDAFLKMAPYMMPIFDILLLNLTVLTFQNFIASKEFQVIPLAFMRGLTMKRSFVVFDLAQNASPQQMRLFLTRIGEGTKVVVNGDLNQIDRQGTINGLADAISRFSNTPKIGVVKFTLKSIVRSLIVKIILQKYKQDDSL